MTEKFRLRQPNFFLYNRESFSSMMPCLVNLCGLTHIGLPQYDIPRHSIDWPSSRFAPLSVKVWIRHWVLLDHFNPSAKNPGDSPAWFIYIYAMFYIFMQCFISLYHDLYIYAIFYIFMPCFIYLCQFQFMLHHYSPRFPFLLYSLLSFMLYQHKFMSH